MDSAEPDRSSGRRRAVRWLLTFAIGAGILASLLWQTSLSQWSEVLRRGRPGLIAGCFGLSLLTTLTRAARYRPFAPSPSRLTTIYGVFAVSRAVIYVLPFRTGELVMLSLLKKRRLSATIAQTLPAWFLLRICDIAAVAMLALLGVALAAEGRTLAVTCIALAAAAVVGLLLLTAAGGWWRRADTNRQPSWLSGRLAAVRRGLAELSDARRTLRTLAVSAIIWSLMAANATLVQLAFGSPLPLHSCIVVSISMLAIGVLPIHGPLGIGTQDASWAGLMVLAGMPLPESVALALCYRLVLDANVVVDFLLGTTLLRLRKQP